MRRRTFIASTAAAAVLPQILSAQSLAFDPTPQEVKIKKTYQPGQLLILPRSYYLYFVTAPGKAMRYGIGVGKAGLEPGFQGFGQNKRFTKFSRHKWLHCLNNCTSRQKVNASSF